MEKSRHEEGCPNVLIIPKPKKRGPHQSPFKYLG